MSNQEELVKQIELMDEVKRKSNINMVTCGNCGDVLLHRLDEEEIKCPYCGFESDPCDFPDFFYTGFELSAVYDEKKEEAVDN